MKRTDQTPAPGAIKNVSAVFEAMQTHNLEASRTDISKDYSSIIWENGFNQSRTVELLCFNSGLVVGKAKDYDDSTVNRLWWVRDLFPTAPVEFEGDTLLLTLDETLEFVRHFIWANHNV